MNATSSTLVKAIEGRLDGLTTKLNATAQASHLFLSHLNLSHNCNMRRRSSNEGRYGLLQT
jgi:hypothetical protein